MNYINEFKLKYDKYERPIEMYPEMEDKDIVNAKYRECPDKDNPDICALPPLLDGKALVDDITQTCAGTYIDAERNAPKSERLEKLLIIKDNLRFFLPYHEKLDKTIRRCILSSYRIRRYGKFGTKNEIVLVPNNISPGVMGGSLIGLPGTGKSTAIGIVLARYPRAIRHTLEGYSYIQIPYLCTVARPAGLKAIFQQLAHQIDKILDEDERFFETEMIKQKSNERMGAYLLTLIEKFHIGLIIIDEIQMIVNKKNDVFNNLLTLTAESGVSLMVVGTEQSITVLNETYHFYRRFMEVGHVKSEIGSGDDFTMRLIIRQLWRCQLTKKEYKLTEDIISLFVDECGSNIDFCINVFLTAQMLVIESEDDEDATAEKALDKKTIREAISLYPVAKVLIKEGTSEMEAAYLREKENARFLIRKNAETEHMKELQQATEYAVQVFDDKASKLSYVIQACEKIGINDRKKIERIFNRKYNSEIDFREMSDKECAMIIVQCYMNETKEKKRPVKGKKKSEPVTIAPPGPALETIQDIVS